MIIETERLILTEMTAKDEKYLIEIFSHPSFFYAAALQDNIPISLAAQRYVRWAEESRSNKSRNGWFMSIRDKSSDKYLGAVVLVDLQEHPIYGREIELGYFIAVGSQSKGFASEAATALYDFAVIELQVNSVYTTVTPENRHSQKILEKLGLKNQGLDEVSIYKDRYGNPASRYRYRQLEIQKM